MPRWTEDARRKQADIQKTRKSWLHSTGPKTEAGKKRASRNSLKHGMESEQAKRFKRLLRRDVQHLKRGKALWRDRLRRRKAAHRLIRSLYPTLATFRALQTADAGRDVPIISPGMSRAGLFCQIPVYMEIVTSPDPPPAFYTGFP